MIDVTTTLNGLTFGAGTSIRWAGWPTGLLDTPDIRVGDVPRSQQHGVYSGQDWLGARHVVFDLVVVGVNRADGESQVTALAQAFQPSAVDVPLDVRLFGSPSEYRLFGRPRGIQVQPDRRGLSGVWRARAEFMCSDPRRFATTLSTATTGLPTGAGGLVFAAAAPFVFGSSGSGSTMSCFNGIGVVPATFEVPWVASFTGPLVAPAITLVGPGTQLNLASANLAAGDVLVLDSRQHTVMLNGVASRYFWLTGASRWFDLQPGANSINLSGASGGGNVTTTWRSGWV